jgi:hypothetical protein
MPFRGPMHWVLGGRMSASGLGELRAPGVLFRPPLRRCLAFGLASFGVAQRCSGRTIIGGEGERLMSVFFRAPDGPIVFGLRVFRFMRRSQTGMRTLGFGRRSRGGMFGCGWFLGG